MKNNSHAERHVRFITVEGGEGAGKTTLINAIEGMLTKSGIPVLRTREPGGTAFGHEARRWLLKNHDTMDIGPKAELLLFLADRAQHIEEVIIPALEAGKVVICDRFNDSSEAYQGAGRGLGTEWVRELCSLVCGPISPDLTFYLDVDPVIGIARAQSSIKEESNANGLDRIEAERIEFHHRVHDAFLDIIARDPKRCHRIDATQPKGAVVEQALNILSSVVHV
jgi:dTMP kinase